MTYIQALCLPCLLEADDDQTSDPDASLPSSDWLAVMADRLADIPASDVPLLFAA